MNIEFSRIFIAIFLMLALWACAPNPWQAASPITLTVSERESLAKRYLSQREYANALIQWKVLRTIDPSNPEYNKRIDATEAIIDQESSRHRAAGITFMRRGDYEAAKLSFLKALALDPRDHVALGYLRDMDRQQMETRQKNKRPNSAY